MGTWLRNPKTRQAKRLNCPASLPDGIQVRAKRAPKLLPDTYDDIRRGDQFDRSWKRHRRTQYRAA